MKVQGLKAHTFVVFVLFFILAGNLIAQAESSSDNFVANPHFNSWSETGAHSNWKISGADNISFDTPGLIGNKNLVISSMDTVVLGQSFEESSLLAESVLLRLWVETKNENKSYVRFYLGEGSPSKTALKNPVISPQGSDSIDGNTAGKQKGLTGCIRENRDPNQQRTLFQNRR